MNMSLIDLLCVLDLSRLVCVVLYIVTAGKIKKSQLSRLASKAFPSDHNPSKPILISQAPPIDRLYGHLALSFGDHDSQIAVTLGTRGLEYLASRISKFKVCVSCCLKLMQEESLTPFLQTSHRMGLNVYVSQPIPCASTL